MKELAREKTELRKILAALLLKSQILVRVRRYTSSLEHWRAKQIAAPG